jgi:hypothetical protein
MMPIIRTAQIVKKEGPMSDETVKVCRNIFLGIGIPVFSLLGAALLGF